MRALLSGFDAFGDLHSNPTEDLVRSFPSTMVLSSGKTLQIEKLVLPTCCEAAASALDEAVQQLGQPEIILITGLAETRQRASIERFALNIRDYRMPDNKGHQWQDARIAENGPEAIRTRVPVKELCDVLTARGHACDVSNHAGSFVCNDVYFQALHRWQDKPGERISNAIVFLHLPPPASYCSDAAKPLEAFQPLISDILDFLSTWVGKHA